MDMARGVLGVKKLLLFAILSATAFGQLRVPSLQVSNKLTDTTFIYKTSVRTDSLFGHLYGRADTSSRTDSMKYGTGYLPGNSFLKTSNDTFSTIYGYNSRQPSSGSILLGEFIANGTGESPMDYWYGLRVETTGSGNGIALKSIGTAHGGWFEPSIVVAGSDTLTISHATDTTFVNTTARAFKLNKNLYLDSACWDDIRIAGSQLRNGATAPSFGVGTRLGGIYVLSFTGATGTDDIHTAIQLPHTWKPNTTIYAHVHGAAHAAITGAQDTISCGIEYAFLSLGDTLLTPANCTDTITGYWHITADSLRRHSMLNIGAITPTGFSGTSKKESSMLMIRLFRNTADVKDTYTGNFEIYELDIHFQVHKMGTKNKLSD
jgi:hypothetical protein